MSTNLRTILEDHNIDPKEINSILQEYAASITKATKNEVKSDAKKKSKKPRMGKLHEVIGLSAKMIKKDIPDIRRGDGVVTDKDDRDRNEGRYIWDGEGIVDLRDSPDDYGNLPQEFTLNEFPDPRFFDEVIDHNVIRWIRFEPDDIIKIVPGKYFIVEITAQDGKDYQYKLEYSGKEKSAKSIYKKLPWDNGVIAIEDDRHYPDPTDTPVKDFVYMIYGM